MTQITSPTFVIYVVNVRDLCPQQSQLPTFPMHSNGLNSIGVT